MKRITFKMLQEIGEENGFVVDRNESQRTIEFWKKEDSGTVTVCKTVQETYDELMSEIQYQKEQKK